MNVKVAVAIVVLVFAVAGGWIWYQRSHPTLANGPLKEEFTWGFVDRGVVATTSVPKTDVSLKIAGVEIQLGSYSGTCFAIPGSPWTPMAGELTGTVCAWHGGGKEIGVFEENNTLVLKQADIGINPDNTPASRGLFIPLTKQP